MRFKQTQYLIEQIIADGLAPGMDYAIIEHGKLVVNKTMGASQLVPEEHVLRADQYFDLASLTKVIGTVPAILRAYQNGLLDLADPVIKYLPISDRRITIRHLITHTSGVSGWIANRDRLNSSELRMAIYRTVTFGHQFNKSVEYNDYNYLLLGFILEKLYHQPVQSIIQVNILQPLGLSESTFEPDPFKSVATEIRGGVTTIGEVHDPKAASLGEHAASAGLFATKHDVLKFVKWMMSDGYPVLEPKIMDQFAKNQTSNPDLYRSYGWRLVPNSTLLIHSGFTGNFIILDRVSKNSVVCLSNRVHPNPNQDFIEQRHKIFSAFAAENDLH